MAILKTIPGKETKTKKVLLANQSETTIKEFLGFDGKSLVEVDVMLNGKLTDITVGRKTLEDGSEIVNLLLHYPLRKVAIPMSRTFTEVIDADPLALLEGEFYVRNKFNEDTDTEGEYPYSGPQYISFGKPSGITFDSEVSVNELQVVE